MSTKQFCNSLQHHASAFWRVGSLRTELLVQEDGDIDKFLCVLSNFVTLLAL